MKFAFIPRISIIFSILMPSFLSCGTETSFEATEHSPEDIEILLGNKSPEELLTEQPPSSTPMEHPSKPKPPSPPVPPTPPTPPTPQNKMVTDQFEQNSSLSLDLLWVIDNSGSMQPYQQSLSSNFSAFISEFTNIDVDFQMGVTSTDICSGDTEVPLEQATCPNSNQGTGLQGSLNSFNGAKVIRHDDANIDYLFRRLVNLGTNGSSFEHGLSASYLAIQKSLAGANRLSREDSFLAVVIVSDENDDGVGLSADDEQGINYWEQGLTRYRFEAQDLISTLTDELGHRRFSISSVVGTSDSGSNCPNRQTEIGSEYLLASELTGGMKLNICTSDWAYDLQKLAENIQDQISSFDLSSTPIEGSIEVKVNNSPTVNWTYDSSRNLLFFSQQHLPSAGSKIEIKYLTKT
jgi:hypothetical protein